MSWRRTATSVRLSLVVLVRTVILGLVLVCPVILGLMLVRTVTLGLVLVCPAILGLVLVCTVFLGLVVVCPVILGLVLLWAIVVHTTGGICDDCGYNAAECHCDDGIVAGLHVYDL
jgi:hypothetical protein